MASTLRITLLGNFRLDSGGGPVTTINTPRLQSLLAYLVLRRDAPQSRQHLAFLLWPDSTESQARSNLRTLLHRLRDALPDPDRFLNVTTQTLQWRADAPFTLDVADLETQANPVGDPAAVREALGQVVALYQGDLLPSCYDDWILPERERLRQMFSAALERLILLLEDQRDYRTAIHYAQRLLRHDPLHEATYRRLMRLHALNGDRAGALRVYHTCTTVLERELAWEPSPATREAYERLLSSDALATPPTRTLTLVSPLIGRDQEWTQLQAAWRTAAAGEPRLVLLSGEAGIGKTRLTEELLEWATRQRIATASAHCYAAEGELAYAPVVTWLRARPLPPLDDVWLTQVARLLPELLVERPDLPHPTPLTESWQRRRLFEALARAILGHRGPLLLAIDDLQWCDQETLEWLHYLLRFDPQARLLVVGAARSEEIGSHHPLASLQLSLRRADQLTEIELGPLSAAETALLAGRVAGRELDPSLAAYLFRETEGNPLFVVETVRAGAPSEEQRPAISLPAKVRAVIEARLAQLSPQARELVSVAATIGRAFTFDVLARASGGEQEALVGALDELWGRRVVREQGTDAYDFGHDKIREVAYSKVSTARRRLLHRQVAQALEAVHASNLDAVSGQVAVHYERASLPEQAISYYQRAAEVTERIYANEEALGYLRRALTLLEDAPLSEPQEDWRQETATQLYERLGDILYRTGQHDKAGSTYQDALTHAPTFNRIGQSRLHRKQGNAWRERHRYEEASQAYDLAETTLGRERAEAEPEWRREWIQVQLERMWVHYWLNQWRNIVSLAEKTQSVLEQCGTPAQRVNFLLSLGSINLRRDRYVVSKETLSIIQKALAISQESGNLSQLAWIRFLLGFAQLWHNDLDQAEEQMLAALEVAEFAGDVLHQSRCLTYLTIVFRKRGQVNQAQHYVARSLAVATAAELPGYIGTAKANLAWLAWREGDLPATQAHGQAALVAWGQLPSGHASDCFKWTALFPLIGVTLAQGQTAEVISEAIDHARALLEPPQQLLPDPLTTVLEQAIQAWERGQSDVARVQLERAVALAQELGYL